MNKELKLGFIAIMTLAVMVWGYKFLKGQKLFADNIVLSSVYDDVYQLSVSSPVYINGLPVGSVVAIDVNPENVKEMTVSYLIEGEYGIPSNAVAVMISEGIVGGKALSIEYDHNCTTDCAKTGQKLKSTTQGLLGGMVPKEEISEYVDAFKAALNDSFGGEGSEGMGNTMANLDATIANLASLTASLDKVMSRSASNLNKTMSNIEQITSNMASNNGQITGIISNLNQITTELNNAKMSSVVGKADLAMENTNAAVLSLQKTIENSGLTLNKLNDLLDEVRNGDGSLSSLINDKALYNNMEETSKNLSFLLQDLRLNPKRYVSLSIFGGKNEEEYVKPENDPAFKK